MVAGDGRTGARSGSEIPPAQNIQPRLACV